MAGSATVASGNRWERLALDYLLAHGLEKITGNFRCRFGEIDLAMLDRSCLVFVEVRYRRANRFAGAVASIDTHKQRKLIRTAAMFLTRYPQYRDCTMRFDVVAIDGAREDHCTLQWLRDAFRPED